MGLFTSWFSGRAAVTSTLKTDEVYLQRSGAGKRATMATINAKSPGVDVASAGTVDLTASTGNAATITGTTTITAFTLAENNIFWATAAAALPITYDAANLKIKGNKSVLLLPGDIVKIVGDSSNKGHIEDIIPKAAQLIPRVTVITSDPAPAPNCDTTDFFVITDLDETSCAVAAIAGTPRDDQEMRFRIHAVATTPIDFVDLLYIGCTAPTEVAVGKTLYVAIRYSFRETRWFAVDVRLEDNPVQLQGRPIIAHPVDYTVLAGETGMIFTNTGTSGDVIFTLPASAGCVAGQTMFSFYQTSGAGKIKIEVDGTDHLYFVVGSSGFDITGGSNTQDDLTLGGFMTVLYQGGGIWIVEASSQNWS